MEEGTIISWEIEVGDHIEVGDVIGVVETEKVEVDLESPVEGTVTQILVAEDGTVDVGVILAIVE
jgi:pyruvate/2-oxoglutarate dehydrogenase complex dihydrolipoamide acyltransferase (E2) component